MAKVNGNGRSHPERPTFEDELLAAMPRLQSFSLKLTRSRETAQELVQQTLLRALHFRHQFIPGTTLIAWLTTIARHQHINNLRRSWRVAPWNPELAERTLTSRLEEPDATDDFRYLLLGLASLPQEQSDAIVAVGYLGISYEEAAQRLGYTVGTIKSRVSRGRQELVRLAQNQRSIKIINLSPLRTAAKGYTKDHPFFPIAKAYEELYATFKEFTGGALSADDNLLQRALDSGSFDENQDNSFFGGTSLDS